MPERWVDNNIDASAAVLRSKIASNYEELAEEIDTLRTRVKNLEQSVQFLLGVYQRNTK